MKHWHTKYWHTTTFWTKIKDTVAIFGTGGQIALTAFGTAHVWNYITGGATIVGLMVSIWMDDKDGDGIVDAFQKKIRIKSASPIKVETETVKPDDGN